MLEDAKKSIESILTQRLTSPFYGTLIISWLIWNWKIIYLTFFVSQDAIKGTKIDYILENYSEIEHVIWFPILSTIILLVIFPLITNGSYWLDLIYIRWRETKKYTVERKQLLTVEQSIKLREQIINMEKKFEGLLTEKDLEVEQLKGIINANKTENTLDNTLEKKVKDIQDETKKVNQLDLFNFAKKIQENEKLINGFKIIEEHILGGYSGLSDSIPSDILSFFVSNDLIVKDEYTYKWTEIGKEISKIIVNESFKLN